MNGEPLRITVGRIRNTRAGWYAELTNATRNLPQGEGSSEREAIGDLLVRLTKTVVLKHRPIVVLLRDDVQEQPTERVTHGVLE